MNFDPSNFLAAVKRTVVGDKGFLRRLPLPCQAMATTGTRATASNSQPADAIVLDANDEDVIASFRVPPDYDEQNDHLKVRLLARHVSGTSLDVQPNSVARGNAETDWADEGDFSAPSATTVNSAFDIGEIEADLSGLEFSANDLAAVNFAASSLTGSGVVHVLGADVEYRSTLVNYDNSAR